MELRLVGRRGKCANLRSGGCSHGRLKMSLTEVSTGAGDVSRENLQAAARHESTQGSHQIGQESTKKALFRITFVKVKCKRTVGTGISMRS